MGILDPVDQLVSKDLCTLLLALNLDFLPVLELPLLFFDGDETGFEFVSTEDDSERNFILLPRRKLGWQLWLVLEREFGLVIIITMSAGYGEDCRN